MPSPYRFSCIVAGVFFLAAASGCEKKKAPVASGPPVVPVSTARASVESVPFELKVVGNVEASAIVQIKSQVSGQLVKVNFTEGQNVAKGALLFEIDKRPYAEALAQAQAAVARVRAQLRQAEANLARDVAQSKNADAEAGRNLELSKAGVISKERYEQVRTSADVTRESVRASQAAIESSRAALDSELAAVEKAKLDIAYCEIHAPISGRTGNLLVNQGNLVKANDVPLVIIHQIAPIFVNFSVPEQHLGVIRRLSSRLPVRVSLQDNPARVTTGRVSVIDNTVDPTTGTIKLKGVFDNRDGFLWPGQFVNVTLTLDTIQNATVVPAESVQVGQKGQFVYVVKPDNTVESRIVVAGRSFERKMVIEKGVAPGDMVVTDGHLRLFPGAHIRQVDPRKIEGEKL
ncbi:MAG TPA: efflux RND transporter periplasmic adaptor subunit [Bryobacteraceae bacterium]|nr:efflux RND transporter periplasmic adaptor subunit [Bryobacteraceae bacterium]